MCTILKRKGYGLSERDVTDERVYLDRRRFVAGGLAAAAALWVGVPLSTAAPPASSPAGSGRLYPAPRNPGYTARRPVTPYGLATGYNNYYEFSTEKDRVRRLAERFATRPWTVEITGLVENPLTVDFDDLVRWFPLEERIYRFRCVERWAMVVPWTGFPLRLLVERVRPLSSARYVRFVSFLRPSEAPGQRNQPWFPWPYFEALRLDEALCELTMVVTGAYGRPLPVQNGAPLRIIVPWKYGYKSPKAVQRIEFVASRPETFWHKVAPSEYGFFSNVRPDKPHPRWSQRKERLLGSDEEYDTIPYNGYGKYVAHMYL